MSPSTFSVTGELWLCGFCVIKRFAFRRPNRDLDLVCDPLPGECFWLKKKERKKLKTYICTL
jgi:hypothetical protein